MIFFNALKVLFFITQFDIISSFHGASNTPKRQQQKMEMSIEFAESLPGALPPMSFFDPLKISSRVSDDEVKRLREAEIKHGRVVSYHLTC